VADAGIPVAAALQGSIQVMRAIKQALDPHGLMNPGKIFR
jgi:FAD/FMN-containing dehydrogenase